MKRIWDIVLRWILLILLVCGLIYVINGLNMRLLWFDIRIGFSDNRTILREIVIFSVFLFMGVLIYEFSSIIKYHWKIYLFHADFTVSIARNVKSDIILDVLLFAFNIVIYLILILRSIQPDLSWTNSSYIAHALGEIDGIRYSNSQEALESSYEMGYKIYEVDLSLTSDGSLACTHAWETGLQPGFNQNNKPTAEEFLDTPIGECYTPILFADLCKYMKEHPEIYVITDSKEIAGGGY